MTEKQRTVIGMTEEEKNNRITALQKWWDDFMDQNHEAPTQAQIEEQSRIVHEAEKRKNMKVEDLATRLIDAAQERIQITDTYKAEFESLKTKYVNDALSEKMLEVQTQEAAEVESLIDGLKDEIRICAEVLKERVENAYSRPVTADMMLQIEALTKVDLTESELRLYIDRYKDVPLALKQLTKIANEQGIKTTIRTFDDYMDKVKYIIQALDNMLNSVKAGHLTGLLVSKNVIMGKCLDFNSYMESLTAPTSESNKVGNLRNDYTRTNMSEADTFDERLDKLVNSTKSW